MVEFTHVLHNARCVLQSHRCEGGFTTGPPLTFEPPTYLTISPSIRPRGICTPLIAPGGVRVGVLALVTALCRWFHTVEWIEPQRCLPTTTIPRKGGRGRGWGVGELALVTALCRWFHTLEWIEPQRCLSPTIIRAIVHSQVWMFWSRVAIIYIWSTPLLCTHRIMLAFMWLRFVIIIPRLCPWIELTNNCIAKT